MLWEVEEWGVGVVVLMLGTVVVLAALGVFLVGDRYRRPEVFLSPVEWALLREEVEVVLRGLAPRALRLAERERVLGGASDTGRFWRRFAEVGGLAEEDPVGALRVARDLRELLEDAERAVERGLGEGES